MLKNAAGSTAIEPDFDIMARDNYHRFHREIIRYNDLDPLGHVTSISFVSMFESARILFIHESGSPVDGPDFGWMLVSVDIDYHNQLHFPCDIDIGTHLLKIGRSSVTTIQGMFDGTRCCATQRSVLVHVDRTTDRSSPISDEARSALMLAAGTPTHTG